MASVNLCESFASVQGESTWAGLSCFFIRLAGCNLRCRYCDTTHAYAPGKDIDIGDLAREARESKAAIVEITGGEPMLQNGFVELATRLRDETGKPVLVETNGTCDISKIPDGVIAVMDVKCPGSGESGSFDLGNLARLRPLDEVKFVLSDEDDYKWAAEFVRSRKLASARKAVLFSPVFGKLDPRRLAQWIAADSLPVRLQIQLHKVMGVK